MGKLIVCFLLAQTLMWKIPSTYAQRSIQQYLHLSQLPYTTIQIPAPTQNTATSNQATASNHAIASTHSTASNNPTAANQVTSQPRPTTGLPTLSAISLPNLIAALSQAEQSKPCEVHHPHVSSIDSKLLNNLAIALQLLAIGNILNSPPPDAITEKLKEKVKESSQNYNYVAQSQLSPPQNQFTGTQNQLAGPQNQYFVPQHEHVLPNSNFVGASSFPEPNLGQTFKPARSSMNLRSPYEALGPLSTFSDPLPQFGSANPRKDFQSPYAMMNNDVFSMNDLFKI